MSNATYPTDDALLITKLCNYAVIPSLATDGSVGFDLTSTESVTIPTHSNKLISTGIAISLPRNTYGRIAPRSGLSYKKNCHVGAGVIDRDYRGEIKVLMFNLSDEDELVIDKGTRIAQLIIENCVTPPVLEVDNLDATVRGDGGFGSTGDN